MACKCLQSRCQCLINDFLIINKRGENISHNLKKLAENNYTKIQNYTLYLAQGDKLKPSHF